MKAHASAKAAVDKEWDKLKKIPAWQESKVLKSKHKVIDEARQDGKPVHFATLMDLCHRKSSELKKRSPKYKGRVVPRGDVVKDDSGLHAGFAEQGSSASHMTAAKVLFQDVQDKEVMQCRFTPRIPLSKILGQNPTSRGTSREQCVRTPIGRIPVLNDNLRRS